VQDEYGKFQPTGSMTLNADGTYSVVVMLQASRLGTDKNGRVYNITVTAVDRSGNAGSGSAAVVAVDHDSSK
jgi:hypothetical protein